MYVPTLPQKNAPVVSAMHRLSSQYPRYGSRRSKTPQIVNELINKDRPTSAIVLARQRLFEVLLGGDTTRKICADHEYPPERLIHTTLLKQTGIWSETENGWTLKNPVAMTGKQDISAVWKEISRVLQKPAQLTFADLLEALAAPPFGVRNGPAGIWAALYLIINRNRWGELKQQYCVAL